MTYVTLILVFLWFTVNLMYYGLSVSAINLPGNLYVNLLIYALMEIPCYILGGKLISTKLGRVYTLVLGLLISSLLTLTSTFLRIF